MSNGLSDGEIIQNCLNWKDKGLWICLYLIQDGMFFREAQLSLHCLWHTYHVFMFLAIHLFPVPALLQIKEL